MAAYLIGLAAQNFDDTIFDTEDLSTIRGGSIAAIQFVQDVDLSESSSVSVGGSKGIWRYDGDDPGTKLAELRTKSNGHPVAKYLNFVVGYVLCSNDYLADKAALSAKLSRAQLSGATRPYPVESSKQVCPVDLLSPVGTTAIWYDGQKDLLVSESVAARRVYGLKAKQGFIKQHASGNGNHEIFNTVGLNADRPLAMLLSSISEGAEPPAALKTNLHNKIAVIHLDGNGAGAAQKAAITMAAGCDGQMEAQKAFDKGLQSLRQKLAEAVLDVLKKQGGVGTPGQDEVGLRSSLKNATSKKVIRFEALLWAGDEITFIVPARLGWRVTQALLAALEGQKLLTAAIGLVYCHHDAPIARIRALADRLCTNVKSVDRKRNLVFPLVLESFDHIGCGLDDYLAKRAPEKQPDFFVLDAKQMAELKQRANSWANPESEKSRRQIRNAAVKAHRNFDAPCREGECSEKTPCKSCKHNHRRNMLIEDYWDYLLPCYFEAEASQ